MGLNLFYKNENDICVGIDEAGRGCMIGPVFAAAVIWDPEKDATKIKDSKKISRKNRQILRQYIEENAIGFGIGMATNEEIDDMNILNATYLAMHRALDEIKEVHYDRILVDGQSFKPYKCNAHDCIIGGDNMYVCIAAASILAKEYHDDWILRTYENDTKYDLVNNRGYGTKKHLQGIRDHGITEEHRKTFCKKYM
tara:strand:- start:187 stop:777 length:591 start_codon:yes stop_codon:yes gene_type:complete